MTKWRPALDRFFEKFEVSDPSECWPWQACVMDRSGYGRFSIWGRDLLAHRFAYEVAVGPIPEGLDIDHLCRNRACVNPAHLEAVTRSENLRRGAQGILKTACRNGHPWGEDVPRDARGWRNCPQCAEDKRARRRARHAEKRNLT